MAAAQTLTVDLDRMSRMMDVRYYIAERGELPLEYILLGICLQQEDRTASPHAANSAHPERSIGNPEAIQQQAPFLW